LIFISSNTLCPLRLQIIVFSTLGITDLLEK
jgi:hypothetical protein